MAKKSGKKIDEISVKKSKKEEDYLREIRNTLEKDIEIRSMHENDYYAIIPYLKMINIAYHYGAKNILEIGAGITTVLFNYYSIKADANITPIDYDFERVNKFNKRKNLTGEVKKIEKASLSPGEIESFYSRKHSEYAGVRTKKLVNNMGKFKRLNCKISTYIKIKKEAKKINWKMKGVFVEDNSIIFPKRVVNMYGYEDQKRFLKKAKKEDRHGAVNEMIERNYGPWDLIFLDSGELSSMVEWKKVKGHISAGGLVICHDIFFPKSVKNFLVASSLVADPKWNVIMKDGKTIQGMIVAEKVK